MNPSIPWNISDAAIRPTITIVPAKLPDHDTTQCLTCGRAGARKEHTRWGLGARSNFQGGNNGWPLRSSLWFFGGGLHPDGLQVYGWTPLPLYPG